MSVSVEPRSASVKPGRRALWIILVRISLIGGFLGAWELTSGRWVEPFLISSPTRIFWALVSHLHAGSLLAHFWVTCTEIGLGFPLGAGAGVAVGYWFGRNRTLAEICEPLLMTLYGVPRTALAPLFIVWLGIGIWSKVGIVFLLTFFLNFFNTYAGMKQMDQEYIDLARIMGARGWHLSVKVILPAIAPYILTGVKTSIPFAVIGAIVGEFIAATAGVGFFIRMSAGVFKTADVFAGILVLMLLVIVMNMLADRLEKRVLQWQTQIDQVRVQG